MTTPNKPNARELLSDPRYSLLRSGAVQDRTTGQIVAHTGESPYQITSESSRQIWRRRRLQGERSVLQGLIDAGKEKGLQLPDPDSITDEELESAGGDVLRLITKHTALTYLESKNLRGMAEVYGRLTQPLLGQPDEPDESIPFSVLRGVAHEFAALARQIEAKKKLGNNGLHCPDTTVSGEVIDGDIRAE